MKLAIALAASILSIATFDARAAAPSDVYSVTVQFADLNLDHPAGAAKLYSRIKAAARKVCHEQASEQLVAEQNAIACVKRAVGEAVARIDRPLLTDYVAQLGGTAAKPASVAAR